MPGLFPNPSAAPEALRPGDQVRWYIGEAHVSPYVGVVTEIHPGIQKVDVEFPVGGNQRLAPEDLILVTKFQGLTALSGDSGYDGYDKGRSEEGYGTLKQNLRGLSMKSASEELAGMASAVARKFASDVVDDLASDVVSCIERGMGDALAYQEVYPKYASRCSDAFLRGAVRRVYAAAGEQKWDTYNTTFDKWFERDRRFVGLDDKKTGNSIIQWWDDEVDDMSESGFLGRDPRRWHEELVEYANDHGLQAMPQAWWDKQRKGK